MRCCRPLLRRREVFALVLAALVLASAPADAAVRTRTVVVESERVTLGDLSPTAPRELLGLDIGPAPRPGKSGFVSRAAVQDALRRVGADPELATALPARAEIKRAGHSLTKATLAARVREAASAELPVGLTIDSVLGLEDVVLPTAEHSIDVTIGKLRRSTVATVEIEAGGRRWARQQATLQLSGTAKTPVLRDDLPKGTTVTREHLEMKDVELDHVPEGAMTRAEDLVGQRLRTKTSAKQLVRKAAVEAPPVIERGDVVHVVARGRGLKISRQAVAQQDGAIGQTIKVKASEGELLLGKIESATLVVVGLGGSP